MKQFDTVAAAKAAILTDGQFISTRRHTTSDIGGATYEVVTAGAFGATPDEFADHTSANGNILKLATETPTWFQLGVVTGVVDNAPALEAMFENRFKIVIADPESIQIQSLVNPTITAGKHIVNAGQGRRSVINYTDASAGILLNVTNSSAFITIAGIGLTASADTTVPALQIDFPLEAAIFRRQVTLSGLDVISATGSVFAFSDGIVLNNVWLTLVTNCVVQGDLSDETRVASGITFKGTSVGGTIANCQINHVSKGISIINESRDVVIDGCRVTQVTDAISAILDNPHGRLVVADCSIAATTSGITSNKLNNLVFTGNRINKTADSVANYIDASVTAATGVIVSDNLSDGVGTSGTELGVQFVNVSNAAIHDNVFQDRTTLITLDGSTTRVAGEGNVGDVGSTTVVDSGTGNNIVEAF